MQKDKLFWTFLIIIGILISIQVVIHGIKYKNPNIKPSYNIKYVNDDSTACLTFIDESKYSLYDCDSEPTNYPFDSEYECTYNLKKDNMKFTCKYKADSSKTHNIKVKKWNKKQFKFVYNNKEISLTSED